MASPELQMALDLLRGGGALAGADFGALRSNLEAMTAAMPLPADISHQPTDAGGVPAEWTAAPQADDDRAFLYFHGGGYCIGSLNTHRRLVGELARAAGMRALSVDYRLGPENPYPAAVEDAIAAYRFVLGQGLAPARIGIAGDSAGGGLTMAMLLGLRERGLPLPGAAVGISPWLDLTQSGASMASKAALDPMVQKAHLDRFAAAYLAGADAKAPTASPLFGDLAGLPSLLLQVGTAETLLDDSLRFADHARRAKVDVSVDVYDDMVHVWHAFEAILPEARDAISRIGDFFKRRLA